MGRLCDGCEGRKNMSFQSSGDHVRGRTILGASSAFRNGPGNVLAGYFDIAQFAMNAVLEMYHLISSMLGDLEFGMVDLPAS